MNMLEDNNAKKVEIEDNQTQTNTPNHNNPQKWVKFDEELQPPAIIATNNVEVSLDRHNNDLELNVANLQVTSTNIDLSTTIAHEYNNGDVIVTLLPSNNHLPWITPAVFRPELIPEELMEQPFDITVEDYVQTMELLCNDYRFILYNVCYKRILVIWLSVAFFILLGILFSGFSGLPLFGLGMGWLALNTVVIFLSMWMKFKLARNLELCLAGVNYKYLRQKVIVTLDDRGQISCHKVQLSFIYMDSSLCIEYLRALLNNENQLSEDWKQRMDILANDIIIQGPSNRRLSRRNDWAMLLYLRYISRWSKDTIIRNLNPTTTNGRHCNKNVLCPCQFIEEHLKNKPANKITLTSIFCLPDQQGSKNCIIM